MKAGDELDTLISNALKLELKPFSSKIECAWEVVEKLQSDKKYVKGFHITDDPRSSIATWAEHDGKYFAGFCLGRGMECSAGESAPHAICLAALKVVGYDPNK